MNGQPGVPGVQGQPRAARAERLGDSPQQGIDLEGADHFSRGTGGHPNVQGLELERYQLDGLVRDKKTVYRCGTIGNIT